MSGSTPSFLDPAVANDPYPFYAHLRHEAPVAPLGLMDLWGVFRYEDFVRMLATLARSRRWWACDVCAARIGRRA